jgi:hypothetical protein
MSGLLPRIVSSGKQIGLIEIGPKSAEQIRPSAKNKYRDVGIRAAFASW